MIKQGDCSIVKADIDVTTDLEMICLLCQQAVFLLLIGHNLWKYLKFKIWTKLQGLQLIVTQAILWVSLSACILFFLDNIFQLSIYLMFLKNDPYLQDSFGIQLYVVFVWLVTVMLNTFYMLIAYLWQIIIAQSMGQRPSRRIPYLIILTNVLQFVFMIIKYSLGSSKAAQYFDESYMQIVFTTISVFVLIWMTIQFVKHLKYMQLVYSRKTLLTKIGLLVLGALTRVAYNIYYILSVFIFSDAGWLIELNDQCQRKSSFYGFFLVITACFLFVVPVFAAHSLFNNNIAQSNVYTSFNNRNSIFSTYTRESVHQTRESAEYTRNSGDTR